MAYLGFPSEVDAGSGVTMRLAQDGDADEISAWTRSPQVHRFWGGRALTVEEVSTKYTGGRSPEVVSYVIAEHGRSVGYIQAWQQADHFGLDMFLAVEGQGRGVGPRAARALATELTLLGWEPLTVDPALHNLRGIRAWRRAGFRETGELGTAECVRTQVMAFSPTRPSVTDEGVQRR